METATLDSAGLPPLPARYLAPGSVVAGRYEIIDTLGSGGYAVVYRARDLQLRRDIALKILRADRMSVVAISRFQREVAVARDAASPRLVRVFDIGSSESEVYLTMELVDSGSLRDRLSKRLDTTESIRIAIQILEGLAVLHGLGVVHRDVKPANILITPTGEVKLADFGLARYYTDDASDSITGCGIVGTTDYLSPEQALAKPVDHRSDLYSFGVLLFQMLTGRVPFQAESSIGVLLGRLKSRPPDPRTIAPEVPRWLAKVVLRLLEREPGDRYQSARVVIDDLSRGRTKPWMRASARRSLMLVAAAIVVAASSWAGIRHFQQSTKFAGLRAAGASSIGGVDSNGRFLWTLPNVDTDALLRYDLARIEPGGRPLIATTLHPPGDYRPSHTRRLNFLDPQNGSIIRHVRLPGAAEGFPDRTDTYRADVVRAIDLDGDGIDEIVVSYTHVPHAPSFTVLYEPKIDRSRLLLIARGHHRVAGASDVDGDGRKEILITGINNGMGWYCAAAAVRVDPWVNSGIGRRDVPIYTPDHPRYLRSALLWYALLPTLRMPDDVDVVDNPVKRTISFRNARKEGLFALTYDGFLPGGEQAARGDRAAARELAYRFYREASGMAGLGDAGKSLPIFALGVEAAGRAGDRMLARAIAVARAKAQVDAKQFDDAGRAFEALMDGSDDGPQIAAAAAEGFHLGGDLDRAAKWYERGLTLASFAAGIPSADFSVGGCIVRLEQKRWADAVAFLDLFGRTYGWSPGDSGEVHRQYVHFRAGRPFTPMTGMNHPPGWERYLSLELENAARRISPPWDRGRPARPAAARTQALPEPLGLETASNILRRVDAELSTGNIEKGGLLSLRAVLLGELGRREEALSAIRDAVSMAAADAKTRTVARLQVQVAREREAALLAHGLGGH